MDGNKENVRARGEGGKERDETIRTSERGKRRRGRGRVGGKVSKEGETRGATLGSGNPGLPISSLLLIHSNCICSQIYILFSGFPPPIRSKTTTRHACLYTTRSQQSSYVFTCKSSCNVFYPTIIRFCVIFAEWRIIRSEGYMLRIP